MDFLILPSRPERKSRRYFRAPLPEHLVTSVRDFPGVAYHDGVLLFDRQVHSEESASALIARCKDEPVQLRFQGVGKPVQITDGDLALINEHSQIELSADDVVLFEDYAANDVLMRRPLRFTKGALKVLAGKAAEGRTVLFHHSDRFPVGATIAADVRKDTIRGVEASWLRVRWYAPLLEDTSPERRQMILDARTGVMRYTSIEVRGGKWSWVDLEDDDSTDLDGYVEIDAGADGTSPEMGELSRVYLGAVYGAGDNKTNKNSGEDPEAEKTSVGSTEPTSNSEVILCDWHF